MKFTRLVLRKVARTVLMVGEGQSEAFFLRHLVSIYVQRGSGVRVTIKNARGKGALHVVDVAIRQSRNADYDERAALLDTDVGWDAATERTARQGGIRVFPATPCLEALLLQIHQRPIENRTTAQLKTAFVAEFGKPASDLSVYAHHFNVGRLEDARKRMPMIENLLRLIQTGMGNVKLK